ELARQRAEESAVWAKTTIELETNQADIARNLEELQKQAEAQPQQLQMEFKYAGLQAASRLELDERQTRRLIDVQLVDAGWEADSSTLVHQRGARPEEGRNLAIAEWPSEGGRADYALFIGLTCVGVIEAKRET
ncbi:type I restriction-modification system endonuclease, partial [Rhizobium leguminosarum]|nr:type I restriction-modification system endonuclease [Rhizobium leguminosarum]